MDFLIGLPMTLRKHDAIWVVVCRFSKMALFLPCAKTTTAAQTTDLFSHTSAIFHCQLDSPFDTWTTLNLFSHFHCSHSINLIQSIKIFK